MKAVAVYTTGTSLISTYYVGFFTTRNHYNFFFFAKTTLYFLDTWYHKQKQNVYVCQNMLTHSRHSHDCQIPCCEVTLTFDRQKCISILLKSKSSFYALILEISRDFS